MNKKVKITLVEDIEDKKVIKAYKNKPTELPRLNTCRKTFLGWSRYEKLGYGFMNVIPDDDLTLYAVSTDKAAYVLESHFRGDVNDYIGRRCQFRRYVVDIYLENVKADCGELKIENCNDILYYLGYVPVDGIDVSVDADTNFRGDAYTDAAFFTTNGIVIKWKSEGETDTTQNRHKIVRLMFAFSRWGMGYNEIARRTSDDIIVPAYEYNSFAGSEKALISANFYNGIISEESFEKIEDDENVITVFGENTTPITDGGEVLSRFAVLADSHVGIRYKWENYDWLYGVYDNLAKIHNKTPLDFVLQLGDNIDDGYAPTYKTDYKIYLETIGRLEICDKDNPIENRADGKIPNYEMQGNHDTSMDTRFFRNKLWYTENENGKKVAYIGFFVDYGGYPAVNFNIAGTYESYRSYGVISEETLKFIEDSIIEANSNNAEQIVLCSHFGIAQDLVAPILPESGLGKIENLCKKYGIRLYLNGHEHNKEYPLRKYKNLYDYDAAMTHDKYAIIEVREKCIVATVYETDTNRANRVDVIKL